MAVTPNYGWPIPVATDYVKDGWDAIADLGNAIDTTVAGLGSGLQLIKTQTIGTTVTNVSVSDAFSSTYTNYKIVAIGGSASTNEYVTLQFNGSTTGYYDKMLFGAYGTSTVNGAGNNNAAYFSYAGSIYGAQGIYVDVDVYNPNTTKYTAITTKMSNSIASGSGFYGGIHAVASAYTGFNIGLVAGNITGGTIYVYGYQK